MKILSLLFIALFCQVCYGKAGHKIHYGDANGPYNSSKKTQSAPANATAQQGGAQGKPGNTPASDGQGSDPVKINGQTPQKLQIAQPTPQELAAKPAVSPTGQPQQPAPVPEKDVNPFLDKVDSTLFDLEEGEENGFKVLKLKAKDGVTANKLTYDGEVVWESQNAGDACSMATFYLGPNNDPMAAIYRFERGGDGNKVEGYRQFSGGKWTSVNKDDLTKLVQEVQSTPVPQSAKQSDGAIDIVTPNSSSCQYFNYNFAGNAIRLIVPKGGVSVSKLMDGLENVCTLSSEETLDHVKVYLKGKKPELVLVTLKTSSGLSRRDYARDENGWAVCDNSEEKMKNLKDITNCVSSLRLIFH